MNKILFEDEAKFRSWLTVLVEELQPGRRSTFECIEELERFFGIDLLDMEGHTFEEYENLMRDSDTVSNWEAVKPLQYKPRKYAYLQDAIGLPVSYPCLAVSWLETGSDRLGDVTIRCLEYVYPSDFLAG